MFNLSNITKVFTEQSRVFTLKEGKKLLKGLKNDGFIVENNLTIKGELEAKSIEKEFKI